MKIIKLINKWERYVRRVPDGVIHLKIRDISQLFNSMDPSPFHEKDLDDDAALFIEDWALEYPAAAPLSLILHLEQPPPEDKSEKFIREAIHHFYAHKAELVEHEFKRLMREGRTCLLIGLFFLLTCMLGNEFLPKTGESAMLAFFREGFLIAGWVAMWRPLEIYLYAWWPIIRRARIYTKMSQMSVKLKITPHADKK